MSDSEGSVSDLPTGPMGDGLTQVSSMPLPPMQFIAKYTDEAIREGIAPLPPPPLFRVSSCFVSCFTLSSSFPFFSLELLSSSSAPLRPSSAARSCRRSELISVSSWWTYTPPDTLHNGKGNKRNQEGGIREGKHDNILSSVEVNPHLKRKKQTNKISVSGKLN